MEGASMADAMSDDLYDEPVDNETDTDESEGAEFEGADDGLNDEISAQAGEYAGQDDDDADEGDDDERQAADDEEEERPQRQQRKQSRYDKRIQQVIQQRKEEQARSAELQQQLEQLRQQQSRFNSGYEERMRQMQEDRERLIGAEKELELLRRQRELTEEEGLDPAERLKRQAIREANELNRREREAELAEIRKEHEEFKRQIAMEKQQAARDARINGYDQQANFASASLLEDLPVDAAKGMFDQMKTMVLNWGAAHGYRDLRQAASDFDKFAMRYALAKMRLKNQGKGAQRQKGKNVPGAAPTSKRNVKGKRVPTMDQARKHGHEDVLDAMRVARGE